MKEKIIFENNYNGETILLLALYEKGVLRSDIERLIKKAKELGLYVLCVNTLNLDNPEFRYKHLIDCYIEKYNYGRDFGSYKLGFSYIYKNKFAKKCNRLLMMNDSVYYSERRLGDFISDLVDTDIEVLGATENYEMVHHLGSFCISLSSNIIRHEKIKKFWLKYSNSDLRPKTIEKGEIKFSEQLRECVSSAQNFSALYNIAHLSEYLNNNKDFIHIAPELYRKSDKVRWSTPSLRESTKKYFKESLLSPKELGNFDNYFIHDFDCIVNLVVSIDKQYSKEKIKGKIFDAVKNNLLQTALQGSQIHQNGIIFFYLGLPIIKLDGLYRGVFSIDDIEKIASLMESDSRIEFKKNIYSKPYGGDNLLGWKKAAFMHGLF